MIKKEKLTKSDKTGRKHYIWQGTYPSLYIYHPSPTLYTPFLSFWLTVTNSSAHFLSEEKKRKKPE